MKFNCTVTINQPIDTLVEMFENPDNLKEWQDGYQGKEELSGTPGKPGAKAKMYYKTGKRKLELLETIIENNLPHEFVATYEHVHMTNTMKSHFTKLSETQTRYDTEIEYTQFNGFMPKIMAFLFPWVFKKQTQKWLDQFKAFAEGDQAIGSGHG